MKKYIRCVVPDIYKFQTWKLVFDTGHDGVSYGTLYYKVKDYNPTLVLVQDSNENVFGIYASQVWKENKEFFGTGETFLFSFKVLSIIAL